MPKIKVVGHPATFELDEIKDSVILLGNNYYFKHDEKNLVKVNTPSGGYRLYRRESPLIVETINGTFVKKSDAIKTPDNIYLDKNHGDTIKLPNGEYTHKNWCVRIDGTFYLKSDPLVVETRDNNTYALKSRCVQLEPKVYGKNAYVVFNPSVHIKLKDSVYRLEDTREVISWDKKTESPVIEILHRDKVSSGTYVSNVFKQFKDGNNPQSGRIDFCYAKTADVVKFGSYLVLKEMAEPLANKIREIEEIESIRKTESVRAKLNSKFGDLDDTENKAKIISSEYHTWPGKSRLFGSNDAVIISSSTKKTGGIGYSFGVELETSAGVIPADNTRILPFLAVGDRSIGAAEYVTPVLHGDEGIKYLKELCDLAAEHTFVDDRCSVHVHVGPAPSGKTNCWPLKFDKLFAMAAIKLGTSIEEELYQMLPPARNPYNRHCHSIMRYKDINTDNWREYLGGFVFGPEENWSIPLDLRNYKYGEPGRSKTNGLQTWCGGRYKWLNLVRCYSSCDSPTIELRIWSPSTNFNKVYCYVLLSLAFVYVASNHYREVMAGKVNLNTMIDLAFDKKTSIKETLKEFVESRKEKFKRTNVYNKTKISDIRTITSDVKLETSFLDYVD